MTSTTQLIKALKQLPVLWVPDRISEQCMGNLLRFESPATSTFSITNLDTGVITELIRDPDRCPVQFSLFTRIHHCRLCGLVFCHDCSKKSRKLPSSFRFGDEKVRLCNTCDAFLDELPAPPGSPDAMFAIRLQALNSQDGQHNRTTPKVKRLEQLTEESEEKEDILRSVAPSPGTSSSAKQQVHVPPSSPSSTSPPSSPSKFLDAQKEEEKMNDDETVRSDVLLTEQQALQFLGLKIGATPEDIRKKYQKQMLKLHPDRRIRIKDPVAKAKAEKQFFLVDRAYKRLNIDENDLKKKQLQEQERKKQQDRYVSFYIELPVRLCILLIRLNANSSSFPTLSSSSFLFFLLLVFEHTNNTR